MVFNPTNFDGLHFILPGNTSEKRPKPRAQFLFDQRSAFLRAKDTMVIRTNVGRHAGIQPSLRDSGNAKLVPGVETPGYYQTSLQDRGLFGNFFFHNLTQHMKQKLMRFLNARRVAAGH